jgi:hypothetical protein
MIYAIDDGIDPKEMLLDDNNLYDTFNISGAIQIGAMCRGFNSARKSENSEAAHKINHELGWSDSEIANAGVDY